MHPDDKRPSDAEQSSSLKRKERSERQEHPFRPRRSPPKPSENLRVAPATDRQRGPASSYTRSSFDTTPRPKEVVSRPMHVGSAPREKVHPVIAKAMQGYEYAKNQWQQVFSMLMWVIDNRDALELMAAPSAKTHHDDVENFLFERFFPWVAHQSLLPHWHAQQASMLANAVRTLNVSRFVASNHPGLAKAHANVLTLTCRDTFEDAGADAMRSLFNFLKAGLDEKVIHPPSPELQKAFNRMIGFVLTGRLDRGDSPAIVSAFNGLRAGLDAGVIHAQTPGLQDAFARLLGYMQPERLERFQCWEISNSFNGLKAGLDAQVLHAKTPGLQDAFTRLIACVRNKCLDRAIAQEISNTFNGLKAGLVTQVIQPETPGLRDAFAQLIRYIESDRLEDGTAQAIANTFNGLRAGLNARLIDAETRGLPDAFKKLIAYVQTGRVAPNTAQHLSNTLNGLRAGLDAGVINAQTPGLVDAFHRLIACVKAGGLAHGRARDISSTFSNLKAGLDAHLLNPQTPCLPEAFAQLIGHVQAGRMAQGNAQAIATTFTGLKAGLDASLIDPKSPAVQAAFVAVIGYVKADCLAQGNALDLSQTFNGLKAGLDAGVIAQQTPGLQDAFAQLIRYVQAGRLAQGDAQIISNTFNGVKAGLDAQLLDPLTPGLQDAFGQLIGRVQAGGLAQGSAQSIANTFNGLKAGLDAGVIDANTLGLQAAFGKLVEGVLNERFASATAQHIGNAFSGLKAGLYARVIPGRTPEVQAAFAQLIKYVQADRLAQGDAQAISNTFNGLRSGYDAGLINALTPGLEDAFKQLIAAVKAGGVAQGTAQAISNTFRGLKAGLDMQVIHTQTPLLAQAYERLVTIVKAGGLATGKVHTIAHTFNGLRTGLDAQVIDPKSPDLKAAFEVLLAYVQTERLAPSRALDIGQIFNGLKAGFDASVIDRETASLRDAFGALIARVRDDGLADGDAQAIANTFNGLKAGLDAQVIDRLTPGLQSAFVALMGLIESGALAQGNAHSIGNTFNGLKAGLDAQVIDAHTEHAAAACQKLMARLADGGIAGANAQDIGELLSSLRAPIYRDVLEPAAIQPAVLQLIERIEPTVLPSSDAVALGLSAMSLAALVQLGTLSSEQAWITIRSCVDRLIALPCRQKTALHAGSLSMRGMASFYSHLAVQKGPSPSAMAYREQLRSCVEKLLAWQSLALIQPPYEGAQTMRFDLVRLVLAMGRLQSLHRRYKGKKRQALAPFMDLLDQHIRRHTGWLCDIVQALQKERPQEPVTMQELQLAQAHHPERNLQPAYKAMSDAEQVSLMHQAYSNLKGAPTPLVNKTTGIEVMVFEHGSKNAPKTLRYDCSIYHDVFPGKTQPGYLLLRLKYGTPASRIPTFWRVDNQIYRLDAMGGARLKPNFKQRDGGTLIGIPIEARDFFDNCWFTSRESFCYGQRAFMPQEPLPDAHLEPRQNKETLRPDDKAPTPGIRGEMGVALLPDSSQPVFPPASPWAAFRPYDGCGFIRADLAEIMLKERLKQARRRAASERLGNLSYQALQYYPPPKDAVVRQAIRQQAMNNAKRLLGPLAAQWSAQELKKPAYGDNALYYALTHGKPIAYTPTAVPVLGTQLLLPDATDWRDAARSGLIVGRNPYDTTNLQVLGAHEIGFSQVLARHSAFQYTLTGYSADPTAKESKDQIRSHFFKGMLLVVPKDQWPQQYEHQRLLLSTKDQKMCSLWRSLADKDMAQGTGHNLMLHGCLLLKEEREHLVGVPPQLMKSLAGDYDGDQVDLVPVSEMPAMAQHIQASPKLDNPKLPKQFTPRTAQGRLGNGQKILEMRLGLLQDWVGISGLYNAAPPDMQQQIHAALAPQSALSEVLGEDWLKTVVGEQAIQAILDRHFTNDLDLNVELNAHEHDNLDLNVAIDPVSERGLDEMIVSGFLTDEQRAKIVRTEISIAIKAGTDAEKTTVPVQALKIQAATVRTVFYGLGLKSVPYGAGFRDALQAAGQEADPRASLIALLERRQDATTHLHSIPNDCMRDITAWFLDELGRRGHLGGKSLQEVCRALATVFRLQDDSYIARKLNWIMQAIAALPPMQVDASVLPMLLQVLKNWRLHLDEPMLQPILQSLGKYLKTSRAQKPHASAPNTSQLRDAVAELIGTCWPNLVREKQLPGLQMLLDALRDMPECKPLLAPTNSSLDAWAQRLWTVCEHRLQPDNGQAERVIDCANASVDLTWAIWLSLGLLRKSGTYVLQVKHPESLSEMSRRLEAAKGRPDVQKILRELKLQVDCKPVAATAWQVG